jgi:phosphoribosyl 1,2-cyclic phosphate phosphodiesterase
MFTDHVPKGGGLPQIELHPVHGAFALGGHTIVPVPLMHGKRIVLGYRVGDFAYLTDCSAIPDPSWPLLDGVQALVVDALRDRPHPTHFSVDQAIEAIARVGPARAWLTHIAHDLSHAATCARLPPGVELAYDGLTLQIAV